MDINERITVSCTFSSRRSVKGYGGHWKTRYTVLNVMYNGEVIFDRFAFDNSACFKNAGVKSGDKISLSVICSKMFNGLHLSHPKELVVEQRSM